MSEHTVCSPHFLLQANVNGRVLSQCNLDDLKKEMEMNFGDWQLFRNTVRLFSGSYLDLMFLASDLLYIILRTMTIYGLKEKPCLLSLYL